MRSPNVIRVGDLVRIKDTRSVVRVGYPKCASDYLPEIRSTFLARVEGLFDEAAGVKLGICTRKKPSRLVERTLHDLAYRRLRAEKFGGPERSLHLSEPVESRQDCLAVVLSIRSVNTGTYYGPSGGRTYDGDDDYEPGGLDRLVVRRLVMLDIRERNRYVEDDSYTISTGLPKSREYPVNHLQKMRSCTKCLADGRDESELREVHSFKRGCCYFCGTRFEPLAITIDQ